MLSWVAVAAEQRNTAWREIFKDFCTVTDVIPISPFAGLAVTSPILKWHLPSSHHSLLCPSHCWSRKTQMQFFGDENTHDCVKTLAWIWGNITKECRGGDWKKTKVCLWLEVCQGCGTCRIPQGYAELAMNLTWVWLRMIPRSSWGSD